VKYISQWDIDIVSGWVEGWYWYLVKHDQKQHCLAWQSKRNIAKFIVHGIQNNGRYVQMTRQFRVHINGPETPLWEGQPDWIAVLDFLPMYHQSRSWWWQTSHLVPLVTKKLNVAWISRHRQRCLVLCLRGWNVKVYLVLCLTAFQKDFFVEGYKCLYSMIRRLLVTQCTLYFTGE
jgi:hypothetical protein